MKDKIQVMIMDDHQGIVDGYLYRLSIVPNIAVVDTLSYGEDLEPALKENPVDVLILDVEVPASPDNPNAYPILHTIPKLLRLYPNLAILVISVHNEPGLVRATMGALFKQTLVRTNIEHFRRWIQTHRPAVIGASPDGVVEYDQVRYTRPTVLLLGHERSGLTAEQRALCEQIVRIPMVGDTDSLNLAVAGSLLLYAVFRSTG